MRAQRCGLSFTIVKHASSVCQGIFTNLGMISLVGVALLLLEEEEEQALVDQALLPQLAHLLPVMLRWHEPV